MKYPKEFNSKISNAIGRAVHEYRFEKELPDRVLDDVKMNIERLLKDPMCPVPQGTTVKVSKTLDRNVEVQLINPQGKDIPKE